MAIEANGLASARRWWTLVREIGAFCAGIWILVVKDMPSTSLQVIGFACLGITASGAAQRLFEKL